MRWHTFVFRLAITFLFPRTSNPLQKSQPTCARTKKAMADAVLVKKSNVPLDLVMFDNADTDPGLGSYQMVPGSYTFYVKHPTMIESVHRACVHARQVPYMMDSAHDEDKVIVPTVSSIMSGSVHYTFRFQHSKDNPTHYLDWKADRWGRDYPHSHPILKPKRRLDKNTELTFDYNLTNY